MKSNIVCVIQMMLRLRKDADMLVRVAFYAYQEDIEFPSSSPLVFAIGGNHSVSVSLKASDMPNGDPHLDDSTRIDCFAEGQWDANAHTRESLRDLTYQRSSQKAKPDRSPVTDPSRFTYLDDDDMPDPFWFAIASSDALLVEFIRESTEYLTDSIRRTFLGLRWRLGISGNHDPLNPWMERWEWSDDGTTWAKLPITLMIRIPPDPLDNPINDEVISEVAHLVQSGGTEPLAHQLFREAWEQRRRNPRSALVIGVAALEAGLKTLVIELLPANQWLLENTQSPSVDKMLNGYLPQLPARLRIGGQVLKPHKENRRSISNAVEARNKIVHLGTLPSDNPKLVNILTPSGLDDALLSIRDVLWMFDYYLGSDWAIKCIRNDRMPDGS